MITCEDIFNCGDVRELRRVAREYYVNNIANTEVYNEEIGVVKFSKAGYKKPMSFGSDKRKLLVFPYLREIIKMGKIIKIEEERHGRGNIDQWFLLEEKVNVNEIILTVRVNIREDNSGKLYYDHYILR
ncbi:MAG: hypothetical protein LBG48_00920 [Rickettsiales bacterium]|jgi:hypothetical protein|nr:hypothetical protein [Rickettsiales bacterium]